jgi:hypothetical protein
MSTPKKKPACKAKPAKKPARQTKFQAHGEIVWEKRARPIPPPPPGWEIVGKDDPRLKKLPCQPLFLCEQTQGWKSGYQKEGDEVADHFSNHLVFALPIATQSATPQPAQSPTPMIRLRLPSEKPTEDDANEHGDIVVFEKDKFYRYYWARLFNAYVVAWLPGRLPEGILPREPSQEERLRAEFEECFLDFDLTKQGNGEYLHAHAATAWRGFLAAKKGGAK